MCFSRQPVQTETYVVTQISATFKDLRQPFAARYRGQDENKRGRSVSLLVLFSSGPEPLSTPAGFVLLRVMEGCSR